MVIATAANHAVIEKNLAAIEEKKRCRDEAGTGRLSDPPADPAASSRY